MSLDTFIETASIIEKEIGINMHLDLVFNRQMLNKYFDYNYNKKDDVLHLNFEIDEGSAEVVLYNINTLCNNDITDCDYDYNNVVRNCMINLNRTPSF